MIRPVCDARAVEVLLDRLATDILAAHADPTRLALVGIQTRGVPLARRLLDRIEKQAGLRPPLGVLDITFYRDDFDRPDFDPEVKDTRLEFDPTGRDIVLVDDVLYTGRTVRAAIDAILDFGRPARIELAVLVDRPGRELPIAATYVGVEIDTGPGAVVQVRLTEVDPGTDTVNLLEREPTPAGGRPE